MAGWNSSTQYRICRIGMAVYVFKELWVARCRAKFEDHPMNSRSIYLKVMQMVQPLILVHTPKCASKLLQVQKLETLGITPKQLGFDVEFGANEISPAPGWFKLNIDGSAKGENSSGG